MKKTILCVILLCLVSVSAQAQWWTTSIGPNGSVNYDFHTAYDSKRGVVVALTNQGDTWQYASKGWSLLEENTMKEFSRFFNGGLTYDKGRDLIVFYSNGETWEWDRKVWKQKNSDGPGVWKSKLLYHPDRKMTLLVCQRSWDSEVIQTWAWDGKSWEKMKGYNELHSLDSWDFAWDYQRRIMVLMAETYENGYQHNRIYELENNGWVWKTDIPWNVFSTWKPEIAYNPNTDTMWAVSDYCYHDERILEWNGKSFEVNNSYRLKSGDLVCDYKHNRLLLLEADSWDLRRKRAIKLGSHKCPPSSTFFNTYSYNSDKGKLALIHQFRGELFEWDGRSWTSKDLNVFTSASENGRFVYFPPLKGTIYFGGGESESYPNEDGDYYPVYDKTYIWKNNSLFKWRISGPDARANFAMTYHSGRKSMFLFGGDNFETDERDGPYTITGGFYGDTWEFREGEWKKLEDSGPSGRSQHSMVYDKKRNKIVLFGGRAGERLGDTWEWDQYGWKRVSIKGPAPRERVSMVYDSNLGKVILFSGNVSSGKTAKDVWTWDGQKWESLDQAKGIAGFRGNIFNFDRYEGQSIGFYDDKIYHFGPYRPTISASTDFDGDGKADPSTFDARGGEWLFRDTGSVKFGKFRDVPAPGDYNGDGKAQMVVYRPDSGSWIGEKGILLENFGKIGDIPVPGDYDGDGKDDIAYFRPSNGRWCINGKFDLDFGKGHDVPVPGDYNGDKKTDIAVYRAETGTWYFADGSQIKFGEYQDIPVPADYNGDGKTDLAVYRQSTGQWIIKGQRTVKFGYPEDIPIPMDYDGDGKDDLILYRANTGEWVFPDDSSFPLGKPHSTPVH